MAIRSNNTDEFIQGINDHYGKQERKANSLGRQILSYHGYFTHKLMNFNSELFPDVRYDMGIDEAIFRSRIPKDDPLKLRKLKSHYDDTTITIDYKSNNLKDPNSIYIKLKPYHHPNKYFEYTRNSRMFDPIAKNIQNEKLKRYYINHQILSRENKSDLMIYLKYKWYNEDLHLKQAYLIGKDILKKQVIDLLNQVLKEAKYPEITNNETSLRVNKKITKAYQKVQEDPSILKRNMELVKIKKDKNDDGDIMLRIPERYLNTYIKVDKNGEIIFTDITD